MYPEQALETVYFLLTASALIVLQDNCLKITSDIKYPDKFSLGSFF